MSINTTTVNHHAHEDNGSKSIFGVWVYIMSDCILFATLFAVYVVLQHNTFGGVGIKQIASLPYVLLETFFLLISSLTCGFGYLAMHNQRLQFLKFWLLITFLLGLGFIILEYHEFAYLVHTGNSWQRSAFLSAFFTLVGAHGIHVLVGMIWILVLVAQFKLRGFTQQMRTRFICFSLFWHFLDIVWIFIFTIVYLMGAI